MHLPKRYWDATIEQVPSEARDETFKYLGDRKYIKGDGLFICGDLGVGKSALAAILLMELRRRGYSSLWVEATNLVDHIMNNDDFDWETSWIERVRKVDVLVIDDLGAEHHDVNGVIEKKLESIVRVRIQSRKVTIVTCNVAPTRLGPHTEGMKKRLGIYRQKFVSMIREALLPIRIDGPDRREETLDSMT